MSRRRLLRGALAGALALLLAGCFGGVKPEGPADSGNSPQAQHSWEARRSALRQVRNFSLQGRLAETGLVSFGGDLSWIQTGASFQARFYGPLGVGAVAISGSPDSMQIQNKNGVYQTQEPEALMQQQFGWSLPVDGLRYWVLGLPAPGETAALKLDDSGHILSMTQNGWDLVYTEYQSVAGLDLPRKFAISDPQRGFRVLIDVWSSVE
ncbi:MAG: lipoprotein insertase outer membrane protein LolB [Nevskia sp.]|nr:lipoprotein insertase outer membrane protein LolB [Nevskia sp.]